MHSVATADSLASVSYAGTGSAPLVLGVPISVAPPLVPSDPASTARHRKIYDPVAIAASTGTGAQDAKRR